MDDRKNCSFQGTKLKATFDPHHFISKDGEKNVLIEVVTSKHTASFYKEIL